jgi:hypothetical protein
MTVRLAAPDSLFTFDVETKVDRTISGDKINW